MGTYEQEQSLVQRGWNRLKAAFGGGTSEGVVTGGGVATPPPEAPVAVAWQKLESSNSANNGAKPRLQLSREKTQVWENAFYSLVERRLREQFHPKNYARMHLQVHTSTNLLQSISREISVLYEEPARRKLVPKKTATQTAGAKVDEAGQGTALEQIADGTAAPTEAPTINTGDAEVNALAEVLPETPVEEAAQETPFDRLMRLADWDTVLDTVELLSCVHPAVWVRPVVTGPIDERGQLSSDTAVLGYRIYTPAEADVVPDPDNPTRAQAFWYTANEITVEDGKAVVKSRIHFWNAEYFIKYDRDWKEKERHPNPYKRIPVAVFRRRLPVNKYYADGEGDDLFEATLELCVLRTIQNARARDSGFKQIVVTGADPKQVPADMVMGGPTPVYLPGGEDASAAVLDLTPDLKQYTELCKERAADIRAKYGVVVDVENTGAPESGYAKKLKMARVLKESRRVRKFFAESEKDLYHLTAVTLREHPIDAIGKLDETAELQTDFGEPRFEENPHEQAKTDALDMKMNKRSIIDVLRDSNPDLSDAELVELAYRNKRINEVLMTSDQVRLTDVLASGAIVGGSLDKGGPNTPPANDNTAEG